MFYSFTADSVFSLSLCQICLQDDFPAQLQSVNCSPITNERERDPYTPSLCEHYRQFVLHNLTPSVKKCEAWGGGKKAVKNMVSRVL